MSSWGWTYNLGQNKMEQQTPIHPPPQKKSFPIFDLGERGALGLPFILSKIVAWYFNISLEGVLFSTVAANVLQVSQFNWSLPLFTHISQGEGEGKTCYTVSLLFIVHLHFYKNHFTYPPWKPLINPPNTSLLPVLTNNSLLLHFYLLHCEAFSLVSDFLYCTLYTCPL